MSQNLRPGPVPDLCLRRRQIWRIPPFQRPKLRDGTKSQNKMHFSQNKTCPCPWSGIKNIISSPCRRVLAPNHRNLPRYSSETVIYPLYLFTNMRHSYSERVFCSIWMWTWMYILNNHEQGCLNLDDKVLNTGPVPPLLTGGHFIT